MSDLPELPELPDFGEGKCPTCGMSFATPAQRMARRLNMAKARAAWAALPPEERKRKKRKEENRKG